MNLFSHYVLTASDESQAQAFRSLLDRRIRHGLYPREISFCSDALSVVKRERQKNSDRKTLAREARYHKVEEDEVTYAEELLREGLEKGLEEGREQGALAGRRAVLSRQLSRRFVLTDGDRSLIEACDDPDALDAAYCVRDRAASARPRESSHGRRHKLTA